MKVDKSPYASRCVEYETLHDISEKQFDALFNALNLRGEQKILDCGAGYASATLAILDRKRGTSSVAVDVLDESITQLERAHKNLMRWSSESSVSIRFIEGSFPDGPFSLVDFTTGGVQRIPLECRQLTCGYSAVICKMVLHDVPKSKQAHFVNGLARCLAPGGRLLMWETLLPQIAADFIRKAVRNKDEAAGFTDLAARRYLFSSDELYTILADSDLRDITPEIHFDYRFNTKRRAEELQNDPDKISVLDNNLRKLYAEVRSKEAKDRIAFTDTTDGIEFSIPIGILSACASDEKDYLLRPVMQRYLQSSHLRSTFQSVTETILKDRGSLTLGNESPSVEGLLRINILTGMESNIPKIEGGLDYMIGPSHTSTSSFISKREEVSIGYLLYLSESFYRATMRGTSVPLGIAPFLQKVFSTEPGCMWLSVKLINCNQCELRIGGYSTPVGLYQITSECEFMRFGYPKDKFKNQLSLNHFTYRDVVTSVGEYHSSISRIEVAGGSIDDFARKIAAEWHASDDVNLETFMSSASSMTLHEIFPAPHVDEIRKTLLPAIGLLCKFMYHASMNECHYVIPPSIVRETGRTDRGSATICTFEETTPNRFLNVVQSLVGIWTGLGYHLKEMAFERLIESNHRAAKAALMTRNFSHNIGSHSMANDLLHSLRVNPFRERGLRKEIVEDLTGEK